MTNPSTVTSDVIKNWTTEFATVNQLVHSSTSTGRSDAFILAWTKYEKQLRRLFTFLVYQMPAFSRGNVSEIVKVIASEGELYSEGFVRGFDAIYSKTFNHIIGQENKAAADRLTSLKKYRHKLFHGQLTGESLGTAQLKTHIDSISNLCLRIGQRMDSEIGYDGMGRSSFTKSGVKGLPANLQLSFKNCKELQKFIQK